MKKLFWLIILWLVIFVGSVWAGNKIDPVGQEYINQIKNLSVQIVVNNKAVDDDLDRLDTKSADKGIEKMYRFDKEFKALKLDALKYYKGKFPKEFVVEWNKYEDNINAANRKKPKKEEFPAVKPVIE